MSSERAPTGAMVREYHRGGAIEDNALARALRIEPANEHRTGSLPALLHRFGNQNFSFGTLSFRELREIFRAVRPRPDELFCDAGAGYGHAVFYGAYVADCRFRAIEILPVRCSAIRRTARRLGLDIEVVQADALAQSYADVSYLFVNNPFFPDQAKRFVEALAVSRKRPLTVIAVHNIVDTFRRAAAFREINVDADLPNYCFGVFRWKPPGKIRDA